MAVLPVRRRRIVPRRRGATAPQTRAALARLGRDGVSPLSAFSASAQLVGGVGSPRELVRSGSRVCVSGRC
eukprot:6679402-Prymnesium_polylepis.1